MIQENKVMSQGEQETLDKKAQALLEEKEAESRTRIYSGPLGTAITVLLCV